MVWELWLRGGQGRVGVRSEFGQCRIRKMENALGRRLVVWQSWLRGGHVRWMRLLWHGFAFGVPGGQGQSVGLSALQVEICPGWDRIRCGKHPGRGVDGWRICFEEFVVGAPSLKGLFQGLVQGTFELPLVSSPGCGNRPRGTTFCFVFSTSPHTQLVPPGDVTVATMCQPWEAERQSQGHGGQRQSAQLRPGVVAHRGTPKLLEQRIRWELLETKRYMRRWA